MWLKQNTASQEILLGPFLDDTDGKTAETGLTIANTDIQLFKDGSTAEVNKNSGGATHISNGRYYAVLDATDTNTLGKLEVNVFVSGALPVRREFIVLPANAYDSLVSGTDYLQADAMQIEGADATDQINAACDVAINDASLATSAALATAQADLDTLTGTDGVTLATSQPNYAPNTTTPPTAAAVADAVWDEARTAHTTAGSFGEGVKVESLNTQAKADVNAEADTAISDASLATSTALATAQTDLDTLTGADGVTLATSQPNYAPNTTTPPTAAAIRAEVDSNSTQLAAIVADTNELQADLANGGRLDLILDSILAALDDPRGEPGSGAPPVNPDAMTKLDYLYKAWRNKKEQTSAAFSLYDDAGTTVDHQATVSDDGTTATFGEIGAGS